MRLNDWCTLQFFIRGLLVLLTPDVQRQTDFLRYRYRKRKPNSFVPIICPFEYSSWELSVSARGYKCRTLVHTRIGLSLSISLFQRRGML